MKWSLGAVGCMAILVLLAGMNSHFQAGPGVWAAPGRVQEAADYAALLKDSKVSLAEGIEKALAEAPQGIVTKAGLEGDKTTHWAIDVAKGDKVLAVDIDVKTGKVVGSELENSDQSKLASAAKVAIQKAIEAALKKSPGQAVSAELKLSGGAPEFTVKILAKEKLKSVKVSGETGEIAAKKAAKKSAAPEKTFTTVFPDGPGDFASTGRNAYFILEPGYFQILEGKEDGKDVRVEITVLGETRKIDGVETRIVEDKVSENGQLIEVARDFFAFSTKTSNVYYFGEEVDNYKNGAIEDHKGSWISGEKGAKYGLQMPGTPLLGARFFQEQAPGAGMDRIEIVSLTETLETPAGKFDRCLKTEETSPLEPGTKEYKLYAPGIGLVQEGGAKLVKYGKSAPK